MIKEKEDNSWIDLGRKILPTGEQPCLMEQAEERLKAEGKNPPYILHLSCPCPKCRLTCL